MPARVYFQKLDPRAVEPKRMTEGAAGYDLTSIEKHSFADGELRVIRTGLALSIPKYYEGQIRLRSSLAKRGFWIPNAPGTIDSDYRGEILILLRLSLPGGSQLISWENRVIEAGERVVQLVIADSVACQVRFQEVLELEPSKRGTGRFGSTGKTEVCSEPLCCAAGKCRC